MSIQPWKESDHDKLVPRIMEFLTETYKDGRGDIKPTPENAEVIFQIGVERATGGDPCLTIWKDDEIAGFTFWIGGTLNPLFDVRDNVCSGLGTFVHKEYRRQGFSRELRIAALDYVKKAGYTRLDGTTYDKLGLDTVKKLGAKAVGLIVSWRL